VDYLQERYGLIYKEELIVNVVRECEKKMERLEM
jgi:hypothetical protein